MFEARKESGDVSYNDYNELLFQKQQLEIQFLKEQIKNEKIKTESEKAKRDS